MDGCDSKVCVPHLLPGFMERNVMVQGLRLVELDEVYGLVCRVRILSGLCSACDNM